MGLAEAVLDIAQRLDNMVWFSIEVNELDLIKNCIRELRLVVKASEGSSNFAAPLPTKFQNSQIEEEKIKQRELARKLEQEAERTDKGMGFSSVEIFNPDDPTPTFIEIDPAMPVNAKTMIGKEVYQLQADGKLHKCFSSL